MHEIDHSYLMVMVRDASYHVAQELSCLIGQLVTLDVSSVQKVERDMSSSLLYLMQSKITGELKGQAFFMLDEALACNLAAKLLHKPELKAPLSPLAKSSLEEVASIFIGNFLFALTKRLKLSSLAETPVLSKLENQAFNHHKLQKDVKKYAKGERKAEVWEVFLTYRVISDNLHGDFMLVFEFVCSDVLMTRLDTHYGE
ncbi:hypothetical protein [Fangia hongkongensis]|uniref:hypothetical protein n=1 Tax=Fangia hongkongensis TaxID=270495 RepID=UPI000378BE85|nr:hypothetical protein [Fangia hongkongensis]MBK2124334.1 hypothetical protein [Fangia hongkongensis]